MSEFTWGVATAAYQIEGAVEEDGRGESIWDRFSATPGKVRAGDTGAVACDFYRRYPEDIALMRELGIDAFRFSIAWPRVVPAGRGAVNAVGLDFYDRLVDDLLAAGIHPFPTLYHWDLPQALEDEGGWVARSTAEAFVGYATAVVERLGDRVTHWATHNEPWCAAWLGYGDGIHAPGRTNEQDAVDASHHLLLSHGWAVEAIRREAPGAQVGIVLNLEHVDPATDSDADRDAAREVDGRANRWFLDPIFRGAYPDDLALRPPVRNGDLESIAAPIDFLGVNNYFRFVAAAGPTQVEVPGVQRTSMGWEVHPDGLYKLLVRVASDYAPPAIYVTENGAAYEDVRGHDGRVRDPERTEYLATHIDATCRARRGRPGRGLLRLELPRQLRMGRGLLETVRDRLRRLSDTRARPEGQFPLVQAAHREPAAGMRTGLQLYTVRDACDADLEGTLRTVARLGYEGVELYSLHGRDAGELRAVLDELGLVVSGRHVMGDADPDALADEMRVLGCDRVALAWIDPIASAEARDTAVDEIVRFGERIRAAGLQFGFHNHWTEPAKLDDGISLLERLPDWIWLELDLGWVWHAGLSPAELLEWARGRTPLVHCKDLRSRDTREFVPAGDGGVGYPGVLARARELGVEWLIAEQDELDRPLSDALERSLTTLKEAV